MTVDPIAALRASWGWVVALAVLGAVTLGVAATSMPETWTSRSTLLFTPLDPTQALTGSSAPGNTERVLASQDEVVLGDAVVQRVVTGTGLTARRIRDSVLVSTGDADSVVQIAATGRTAAAAQRLATTVTDAYVVQSRDQGVASLRVLAESLQPSIDDVTRRLGEAQEQARVQALLTPGVPVAPGSQTAQDALATQLAALNQRQAQLQAAAAVYPGQVSVLAAADLPREPSSLSAARGAALGLALGLLLGVLLALYRAWRPQEAPEDGDTVALPSPRRRRRTTSVAVTSAEPAPVTPAPAKPAPAPAGPRGQGTATAAEDLTATPVAGRESVSHRG